MAHKIRNPIFNRWSNDGAELKSLRKSEHAVQLYWSYKFCTYAVLQNPLPAPLLVRIVPGEAHGEARIRRIRRIVLKSKCFLLRTFADPSSQGGPGGCVLHSMQLLLRTFLNFCLLLSTRRTGVPSTIEDRYY